MARRQPKRVPQPTARTFTVPAPTGGVNTVAGGLAMPPGDCVQAYNLVAAENGLRVRLGEQQWCTDLAFDGDATCRSLLSFSGLVPKLFACTDSSIVDVTESSATPTTVHTFAFTSDTSGYGVSCMAQLATGAGRYLLYADEENGLHAYTEAGATWSKVAMGSGAGEIDGVDPGNVCFVTMFKGRVWMVERDTASAWYLPIGQVFGTAVEFPLGLNFRRGGSLVGLWSWTYDGGSGVDDSLVALSSAGDVVVYQGTDPADASTWGLRGVWYAGPPPIGRRVASEYGGDLLLLTRQGVVPMSRLVVGEPSARAQALTEKVTNLLSVLMTQRANAYGWSLVQHPEDTTLAVVVPRGSGDAELQLVQSSGTQGWFVHRDLLMTCATVHDRQLYYGTPSGTVHVNTGYVDGITLADPNSFTPVQWALLTATSDLGAPTQKQVGMIVPLIIATGGTSSYSVQARYGYDLSELDPVSLITSADDSTWDNAVWDTSLWKGDYAPSQEVRGATGMGTSVALAIRGTSISRTVLVSFAVSFTSGGFL